VAQGETEEEYSLYLQKTLTYLGVYLQKEKMGPMVLAMMLEMEELVMVVAAVGVLEAQYT